MNVPFFDLKAAYQDLKEEIDAATSRVLSSGWYILGPEVEAFEESFARYCGAKHAVGVANGLDALILALKALGIKAGDEVLVPSNTFIATWLAVSELGAIPVPVEPIPETHNIDPARLQDAITSRTKAIIAVHLYGQPASLDEINAIAKTNGLFLIEDAAQAQGARYKSQPIGAHGDAVCWSFYPAKNLGAMGDGGAVTTNDDAVAHKVRVLGNYGSQVKYHNEELGKNSRLDPIHAAILAVKLPHLDDWNERRRLVARHYLSALVGTDIGLPVVPQWAEPVWHQFVVTSKNRDALQKTLEGEGVSTQIHYPVPAFEQPAYINTGLSFPPSPIASRLAREVISLPIGPHQTPEQTEYVVQAVRKHAASV